MKPAIMLPVTIASTVTSAQVKCTPLSKGFESNQPRTQSISRTAGKAPRNIFAPGRWRVRTPPMAQGAREHRRAAVSMANATTAGQAKVMGGAPGPRIQPSTPNTGANAAARQIN